jgi:hypothetical protein
MALKKAGLHDKQSPRDIFFELSKIHFIELNDLIPYIKYLSLERLDEKMGLELFSKNRS